MNSVDMEETNIEFHLDSDHEPSGDDISLLNLVLQRYEGEKCEGQYDGEGLAHFQGAHVYKGMFSKGLMDGAGVFTHATGLKYEGEFVCNMPMGKGIYAWPDGSCYEGEVYNGIRNGTGTYKCAKNCAFYKGQWQMGERHGKGIVYYNKDMTSWYEGDWVNNNREGCGERRYPSGNIYSGEWKNNLRHGEGTMKWLKLGQQYVGEWRDGLQHGQGTHVWILRRADGSRYSQTNQYKGEFVEGQRHGQGTFLYAGGAKYEGQWINDKKHGQGKFTFTDGRVFEGEFLDDRMIPPDVRQMRDAVPQSGSNSHSLRQDMTLNMECLLDKLPEKTQNAERKQVEFVVLRQNAELRSIYSFYSRLGHARSPDNTFLLTRMQLWRLFKDCKVHHHGFTLTQINRFIKGDLSSGDFHSPFATMLFRNLLNCLVTVAYHIYNKDISSQKNLLAACLSKLLTENILPNAKNVKGFLFQQPRLAVAALNYVEKSWEVYQAHCRISAASSDQWTMTCRRLLFMFKDLHLLDDKLTVVRLMEIITAESCDATKGSSCLDLEITFLEFFEVLVTSAEVKCLQISKDLKEVPSDTCESGSDAQMETSETVMMTTDSTTQLTEDSSGEGVESQDAETKDSETHQPEANGGEGKDVESDEMETEEDKLEVRIQAVDEFFTNCLLPAFQHHQLLTMRLKEERLCREAQREDARVKAQQNDTDAEPDAAVVLVQRLQRSSPQLHADTNEPVADSPERND